MNWTCRLRTFTDIVDSRYLKLCSISNNLSGPMIILHLVKAKNSGYLESWYLEFLSNKFSGHLSSFLSLFWTFSKFPKYFCNFCSQICPFSTPTCTVFAIVLARMSQDSQINFFVLFFLIECTDSLFLSPKINLLKVKRNENLPTKLWLIIHML